MKKYILILIIAVLFIACGGSSYRAKPFYKNKVNPKQVFLDTSTGLMWQDNTRPPYYASNWDSAINYCKNMKLAGFEDWRLPSIQELVTLIDYNKSSKNMNWKVYKNSSTTMIKDQFKGLYGLPTPSSYFISSTINSKNRVLILSYLYGNTSSQMKTAKRYSRVICVRGEQKSIYRSK